MKNKINAILENYYLAPHEIDAVFIELCSVIGQINMLGERESSLDEISKKIRVCEMKLDNLESRAKKLRIDYLLSQIIKFRSLLLTIRKCTV